MISSYLSSLFLSYEQRHRRVGEVGRFEGEEVLILRVVQNVDFERGFLERSRAQLPSLCSTGGNVGLAGFERERNVFDVRHFNCRLRSSFSAEQFGVKTKYNCHK
jgi:hypothetical protein